MSVVSAIQVKQNTTLTENGALSFNSTTSAVLDLFANGAAKRGNDQELLKLFTLAFAEDEVLAVLCAFYIGAIRDGQGERSSFNTIINWLADNKPELCKKLLQHIPYYTRWDYLSKLVTNNNVKTDVVKIISNQLESDLDALQQKKPVSLLAKWLPSENASSKNTKELASLIAKELGFSPRHYRKVLSLLRNYINIVEVKMSANKWTDIDYSAVPSKAAKNYRRAFERHDYDGYKTYIGNALTGKEKINSGVLYPADLVSIYTRDSFLYAKIDDTIEAQWKQLPDYTAGSENYNALVMADVSGSMYGKPIAVSISLAIYLAERMSGHFKNHFLTFSASPKLEKLKGDTLCEKVCNLSQAEWGANTNLQAAFDLILETAVENKLPNSEMPTHIFIVTDLEFDIAVPNKTNFNVIKDKFINVGYNVPILVFWNVNSRQNQVPVTVREDGVYLVSGYSPCIFESAINTKASTPEDLMLDVLNSEKFAKIRNALVV